MDEMSQPTAGVDLFKGVVADKKNTDCLWLIILLQTAVYVDIYICKLQ